MNKERLDWLDAARAIGILLVFIGHCDIPEVNPYIYLFHMPLFFIISGFCWNTEKNRAYRFSDFAKKKFKSYIIPYFKICLVCLVFLGIPEGILKLGFGTDFWVLIKKYLLGIFVLSRGSTEWLPHCSPVWFLTCLFCAEIILYFIMKSRYKIVFVCLAGLMGYSMTLFGRLPWNIDNAFSAIPLLYMGILMRKYWAKIADVKNLLILLPITVFVFAKLVVEVDFDANYFENMLLMYIDSIVISATILLLVYESNIYVWKLKDNLNFQNDAMRQTGGYFICNWPRNSVDDGL